MQRRSVSVLISALGLAIAVGCASSPRSAAGLASWDRAHVSELAGQLSAAADAWELAVRQEDAGQLGSGSAEEGQSLTQTARLVSEQARSLAGHLKAGEGRDATYNPFRSLKETVDDAEVESARAELEQPTIAAWAKVSDLMRQITPYYER